MPFLHSKTPISPLHRRPFVTPPPPNNCPFVTQPLPTTHRPLYLTTGHSSTSAPPVTGRVLEADLGHGRDGLVRIHAAIAAFRCLYRRPVSKRHCRSLLFAGFCRLSLDFAAFRSHSHSPRIEMRCDHCLSPPFAAVCSLSLDFHRLLHASRCIRSISCIHLVHLEAHGDYRLSLPFAAFCCLLLPFAAFCCLSLRHC